MKVDITSMFFNSKIEGKTATPAWRTSIGQNKSKECRIETEVPGVTDMIIGMTYKMRTDLHNLNMTDVSGDLMICAVFDKVFVNGARVDGMSYTLLLLRETSDSHEGRLQICYAPKVAFNGQSNSSTIDRMREKLGCTINGCWFVYEITIKNQDELHFSAVVVDENQPALYTGTSQDRSRLWRSLLPTTDGQTNYIPEGGTPRQVIYFGAPGTGKSHTVKGYTKELPEDNVFRTTFHPDSDYATFVGCYKPTKVRKAVRDMAGNIALDKNKNEIYEESITYEFVPQAFTKAYIRAWQTKDPVFLVIEEINRGNCAQIFGDLFQLLDRKNNISEYPIKPDTDLGSYIHSEFKKNSCIAPEDSAIYKGEELCLPANLYIWATMNTSDQSLFPIDSAFKRRWEWRYIKIAKPIDKETDNPFDWHIEGNTDWWQFLKKINAIINKMTNSADKQLGYFFAKADDAGEIKYDRFVAKVCFYLWNDIFKTYAMDDVETDLFKYKYQDEDGQEKIGKLNFTEFFDENGKVVPGIVQQFIENVMKWSDNSKQE